jgi:hypothetical protein
MVICWFAESICVMPLPLACSKSPRTNLKNLVFHRGIAISGSRGGAIGGLRIAIRRVLEVVGHFRVQLLRRFLRRPSVASTASLRTRLRGGSALGTLGALIRRFIGSSRLGLSLGLADALI